jgi:hypothetical protein
MPWVHHPIQVRGLKGRERVGEVGPDVLAACQAAGSSASSSQGIGLRPKPWALFYRPFRPDLSWFESLAVKA